jgi:hypothetical protein
VSKRPRWRFAFQIVDGENAGLGTGSWRIWTHADDIYISAANLGQTIKASLHSTGDWRVAYTSEHMRGPAPLWPTDRSRAPWRFAATPFVDGIQHAFVIASFRNALRRVTPGPRETIVSVADRWDVLTGVRLDVTEPDASPPPAQSLVFDVPLALRNGNRVWLSVFQDPCEPVPFEPIPQSSLIEVLTPERDDVECPGFMIKGLNFDGPVTLEN